MEGQPELTLPSLPDKDVTRRKKPAPGGGKEGPPGDAPEPSREELMETQMTEVFRAIMDIRYQMGVMQRQVEAWGPRPEEAKSRGKTPARSSEQRPDPRPSGRVTFAGSEEGGFNPVRGASTFNFGLGERTQDGGGPRRELKVKFDGDPNQLSFFLTNVRNYMEDYGEAFPSEAAQVRAVGSNLKEAAADWLVQMTDTDAPELRRLDHFLRALQQRFRDPHAGEKAKAALKRIYQGSRAVSEYALAFKSLAGKIRDWSESTKLDYFKSGLRRDLLDWALNRRNPTTLEEWIELAGQVECDRETAPRRYREAPRTRDPAPTPTPRQGLARRSPARHRSSSRDATRPRRGPCFTCGREGHRAAECPKKATPLQREKAPDPAAGGGVKATKAKAAAAREVSRATLASRNDEGVERDQGESDSEWPAENESDLL